MPLATAFSPYRPPPGAPLEEASRAAEVSAAEPLMVAVDAVAPGTFTGRAMALVPAGHALDEAERCRAADGSLAGAPGTLRACLCSERLFARVAEAARRAITTGFAGLCLDRPDAPVVHGLLGAGFCGACQRAFAGDLRREYGEHFQPLDFVAIAREALTQSSGAVSRDALPFGRDFWRFRHGALERAIAAEARSARDAARSAARPFEVVAHFDALGPAQLRASRHLDAAVFPASLPENGTGVGVFRLLRASMGRRPCAAAIQTSGTAAEEVERAAWVAAASGVELMPSGGEAAQALGMVRRFQRVLAARAHAASVASPVVECALLYSAEADLWSDGRHREAVVRAGEALAAMQVQAPVVTRLADVPPQSALVLSDADGLGPAEAAELRRRVETGGNALTFGPLSAVDGSGRPAPPPLPPGKPGGAKVGKGLLVALPSLVPTPGPAKKGSADTREPLSRALAALLGKGRRAASVVSRSPLLALLYQSGEWLDVHLVTLDGERAQGVTLFLGVHVAGGVRRARFHSAEGADEKIVMNPSGYSISTVLPAFRGYAVLSLPA